MNLPERFGSWKAPTTACGSGRPTAPGRKSSPPRSPRPTPKATSTGSSRSTPPSCAPGAVKRGPRPASRTTMPSEGPAAACPRIHLAVDSRYRPLAFVLIPDQAGDAPAFPEVMTQLRVPRPIDRPRTTPDVVLADKAYSSRAIRTHLRRRGIRAVIPSPLIRSPNARSEADPAVVRLPSTARPTNSATPSSDASTNSSRARPGHPIRQDRLHLPRGTPHRRHLHLVSPMFRRFPRWGSNAAPGRPGCLGSRNGRERQGERPSRPPPVRRQPPLDGGHLQPNPAPDIVRRCAK